MGVLHHTPDCEKAVKVSAPVSKTRRHPRGLALQRLQQVVSLQRPVPQDYGTEFRPAFSIISFAWPCLFFIGLTADYARFLLWADPSRHSSSRLSGQLSSGSGIRVLDTLDWYSPKYQSKHTYEQVFRWFESCGLEALNVGEVSVGVRGRKPLGEHRKENFFRFDLEMEEPRAPAAFVQRLAVARRKRAPSEVAGHR